MPLRPPPTQPRRGAVVEYDALPAQRQWRQQQHQHLSPLLRDALRNQQRIQRAPQPFGARPLPVMMQSPPQEATQAEARMAAPAQRSTTGTFQPRLHPLVARVCREQIVLAPPVVKGADLFKGSESPDEPREVLAPDEGMLETLLLYVGVMGSILIIVVVIRFLYAAEGLQSRRASAPAIHAFGDEKFGDQAATPVITAKSWFAEENTPAKTTRELSARPFFWKEHPEVATNKGSRVM
ncbi:hypothetical protein V5799_027196 [Amblyomma americanum]|uniref:Uncharacterized protein n=1 Tax=Amblyomma americanum TaxID=6943 RepID=A0AAQ4DGE9_AMBAM